MIYNIEMSKQNNILGEKNKSYKVFDMFFVLKFIY